MDGWMMVPILSSIGGGAAVPGRGAHHPSIHDPAISPTTPNADMLFPLNSAPPRFPCTASEGGAASLTGRPNPPVPSREPNPTAAAFTGQPRLPACPCLPNAPRGRGGIFHSPTRQAATPGGRAGRAIENASPTAAAAGTHAVSCLPMRRASWYQGGSARAGYIIS